MYTQNKKKFYIIGVNPNDFFDMTIEGVETLLKSEVVIISKFFHRNFKIFLNDNNKKFVFKEDISKNEEIKLFTSIFNLLKKIIQLHILYLAIHILIIKIILRIFFPKKRLT